MSFKRFDPEDIALSAESIVAPAWSNQATKLSTNIASGSQANLASADYYYNMYAASEGGIGTGDVQFAVAYGNRKGSGSLSFSTSEVGKSPSSVIYGQYRTLINGDEDTDFTFGSGTPTPDSVYIISVNRGRFKEKLLPGSFELTLTSGSNTITLIDNSTALSTISYADAGRVYDIVSGSLGNIITNPAFTAASGSYGKMYPDVGVFVFNANALRDSTFGINLDTLETSNTYGTNISTFASAITAGSNFTLRSEETITSNYVFVRVRNSEFNYSTNPSNITGSGELRHNVMVNTPQAYMTAIGLYNDNNDLLGVAKLSKPLLKDFTKEALIRIKLDF